MIILGYSNGQVTEIQEQFNNPHVYIWLKTSIEQTQTYDQFLRPN